MNAKFWHLTEIIAAIEAVLRRQPREIREAVGIGFEIGLDKRHPFNDGELSLYWLATLEEHDALVDGIAKLRRQIDELDIVASVATEEYMEPESSGFLSRITHDVCELVGERWAIAFSCRLATDDGFYGGSYESVEYDDPCSSSASINRNTIRGEPNAEIWSGDPSEAPWLTKSKSPDSPRFPEPDRYIGIPTPEPMYRISKKGFLVIDHDREDH